MFSETEVPINGNNRESGSVNQKAKIDNTRNRLAKFNSETWNVKKSEEQSSIIKKIQPSRNIVEQWDDFDEVVKHREVDIEPTHTQLEETDDSRQGTFLGVRDFNTEQDLSSIVYQNQSPERRELSAIITNNQILEAQNQGGVKLKCRIF